MSPAFTALVGVAGAAGVAALALRRHRALVAGERAWRAAHPVAADGIVPGAGAIALDAAAYNTRARAVLLLHGFGDTPQSLSRQAHALHARGWTVRVPLLPGHGRTLEAFRASDAESWVAAARDAYRALAATHRDVALVGLSMGGALATRLASEGPSPSALVLIVPYLHISTKARVLTTGWRLWSLWRAWVPGNPAASIRDATARRESLGYGSATPRLLRELRRVVDSAVAVAGGVTAPTLGIFSAGDYRISPDAARRGFARIGAREKAVHWVEHSGHVVTVDVDGDEVTARMIEWLERHRTDGAASG